MSLKKSISVFWFRRDLRLFDNTALLHALQSKYQVVPIFIFDTNILEQIEDKSDPRVGFIHRQVLDIKAKLESEGSTLMLFHCSPEKAFDYLLTKYNIREVFANRDYEPYAIARDNEINAMLMQLNIKLNLFKDHIIFEGDEVLKQDGTPFRVFTPFKKVWLEKYHERGNVESENTIDFAKFFQSDPGPEPELSSLGFDQSMISIPSASFPELTIFQYDKKRDFPAAEGTSKLGVHFRFGTISIRKAVSLANSLNQTWLNELIWREFYSAILQHFPYVVEGAFNKKYDLIPWRNDTFEFKKWCEGQTGYPLVDAGMRQLNQTGYMHNRVRMVVASFLTKHLLIDWRWGEAYFAYKLLDYELASNNGGWQWAAGTGTDAQPYFRVFNPESQAEKFDPENTYIKYWIPEYGTKEYPDPIVNHKTARIRAIETYKSVVSK